MLERLKVKVKSLASEASHIREAERHCLRIARALKGIYRTKHPKGQERPGIPKHVARGYNYFLDNKEKALEQMDEQYYKYWGLEHHRKNILRKESRATQLAYGFLRGMAYEDLESEGCYELPDFANIQKIARRFSMDGDNTFKAKYHDWYNAAQKSLGNTVRKAA